MKRIKYFRENGITLISLLITIIILIILAAVTIKVMLDNHFIGLAIDGTKNYIEAQLKEEGEIDDATKYLDDVLAKLNNPEIDSEIQKELEKGNHIVILDANGGKFSENSESIKIQIKEKEVDTNISELIPQYTSWKFLGWSDNRESTEIKYKPCDTYKEDMNLRLYAIWSKDIVLSYDANSGTGEIEEQKETIYSNKNNVTITNEYYTKEAMTFLGFSDSKEATDTKYIRGNSYPFEENKRLYAVWKNEEKQEFEYTGEYQTYKLDKNKVYKIECWGAQGGYATESAEEKGGLGAYTSGVIKTNEDTLIYVYVGNTSFTYNVPSWNNGAIGWLNSDANGTQYGFSGGGATDIRIIPTSNKFQYNEIESVKSRIMVAAGGGGSGYFVQQPSRIGQGGAGGGLTGYDGYDYDDDYANTYCGLGATQIMGGYETSYPGIGQGGLGFGGTNTGQGVGGAGGRKWILWRRSFYKSTWRSRRRFIIHLRPCGLHSN